MMLKRLLLLAAPVFLLAIAVPAGAQTVVPVTIVWDDCVFDRGESDWNWEACTEQGACPPVVEVLADANPGSDDPIVKQSIRNTTLNVWTDWHVDITNGTNLRNIVVYNVAAPTQLWTIEELETGCGFFAHVVSTGQPDNPMAIERYERLYVEFTYDLLNANDPADITQYPTTWYPIPEPSSILALLTGISAFGFGAIRRLKR